MTIKEKPLEKNMFSLAITQLKTKEITQCICRVGVSKETWSSSALPMCNLCYLTRPSPSLPPAASTDVKEKWNCPAAVISSGHQRWRNISALSFLQKMWGRRRAGSEAAVGGLQGTGDSAGLRCQHFVCVGASSQPLCFCSDVATSALHCCICLVV